MATDLIADIARRIKESFAMQLDDELLALFNAGINPSGVMIMDISDDNFEYPQPTVIRHKWVIDTRHCAPLTATEKYTYTNLLVATCRYKQDRDGNLVRIGFL